MLTIAWFAIKYLLKLPGYWFFGKPELFGDCSRKMKIDFLQIWSLTFWSLRKMSLTSYLMKHVIKMIYTQTHCKSSVYGRILWRHQLPLVNLNFKYLYKWSFELFKIFKKSVFPIKNYWLGSSVDQYKTHRPTKGYEDYSYK